MRGLTRRKLIQQECTKKPNRTKDNDTAIAKNLLARLRKLASMQEVGKFKWEHSAGMKSAWADVRLHVDNNDITSEGPRRVAHAA